MRIIVLAAGYGTRLYPLTKRIAKPLIPVNNKPIINFLIEKIDKLKKVFPIEDIVVVSNNKFYKAFCNWKKKYKLKLKIINDGSNSPDDRLGAIQDIEFAIENKNKDYLVVGGDNLFEDSLADFLKFALSKNPYPCVGLYDVKSKKEATRFGVVKINQKKKLIELKEKPKRPTSTLAATCIYYFPKKSLRFLDLFVGENGKLDAAGKYIGWLVKKTNVFGYTLKGKWLDIGHFDCLKLAERIFR